MPAEGRRSKLVRHPANLEVVGYSCVRGIGASRRTRPRPPEAGCAG